MARIFLLEDDAALGRGIVVALTGPEASVTCRSTLAQAREALANALGLGVLELMRCQRQESPCPDRSWRRSMPRRCKR